MQENSEKVRANTQSGGKFIYSLIGQWMKRTGNNVPLNQVEEMTETSSTQEGRQQFLQNQERVIQDLKRKLKESEQAQASLSASLEVDARNKEEIQTKLNATWETIDTITEYFNYISESLASFQQHRVNLSAQYNNVILKQQETIQKLQSSNTKSKDLENHVTQLENTSLLQEERLREAMAEQNKLRKQLEKSEYELQLQKNELANKHAEEKMIFVKEQQRLLSEYENLQSRHQMAEKAKCDIAESAAQLENKLLLQEEKVQEALTEQNKLQKQVEDTEREFYSQKNELVIAHAEEKRMLVEEQQRLLSELESLKSRINMLEQDKNNITEMVVQKDELLSKLQNEISTYKNKIEVMMTSNNEMHTKCEALKGNQDMWEKELHIKTERIQNLEAMLGAIKHKETSLINDVNRLEKKLTNEMDYSKNLEIKLSSMQHNLQFAQDQNAETQKTLERTETTNELANIELQRQLKNLQTEKEEIIKRESTRVKNAEILYEKTQAKHAQEVSALKSSYETRLLELERTIDYLNKMTNDIKKENSALNMSLMEMRMDNSSLKNNYELIMERNKNLQGKLKEATEMLQMKSTEDPKDNNESMKTQSNVSTSADLSDNEEDKQPSSQPSSQPLKRAYSIKRQSQKEQEAEVTSVGKKFFKSRPVQLRTYHKRRQNWRDS